jgi:carboxylesterase type B
MFFIHGGGFEAGTQLLMDASRFGEVADVIVVSINYRLGPIGFMCLDTEEAAGNMGMLDMIVALQWVQDNIEKFGGDPNQVTIFGESAGAAAIGHLVLSNTTVVRP